MLHIHNNRSITLPKILKRPIKLYNARIRWRGESLLKSMSNTMRDLIIYHKMQYIHYKRGEQCAQNKLILLLLTKKERVDMWRRTNKIINFRYIRRKKQNGAINKVEGTLTKKIWLHLHSSIKIIVVRKLCHTLSSAWRRGDPSWCRDWCRGFCFCKKGSRHLVLQSLENLTGLSEILRQETGCVKVRY